MSEFSQINTRSEYIAVTGQRSADRDGAAKVTIEEFVSGASGARGISSGIAIVQPGAELPYHLHRFSEAVIILEGWAEFSVEGRHYHLAPLDTIHVPAGVAHYLTNSSSSARLIAYWAFATDTPSRELVPDHFIHQDRRSLDAEPADPECTVRFAKAPTYELSEGAIFTDLFGSRFGAVGICGGYGLFAPGASLPCHIHEYDESITIITGRATCQVMGRHYKLSDCATALVPTGRPHRFINQSSEPMAMIWLYAGGEPQRTILEAGYCSGLLQWPNKNRNANDR